MTCIVGLIKGDTVWMGGDSCASDGHGARTIIKDPKVFVKGELAFGVCGLPKVMDALLHSTDFIEQAPNTDDRSYLVNDVAPAINVALKKAGCTVDDPQYGTCFMGSMLVGYRGQLLMLEGNFQLVSSAAPFMSVGSGSTVALGSMQASKKVGNPRKRILMALEAATEHVASVAPPFVIINVKKRPR